MKIYQIAVPNEETLYVYAEFLGAALQKARRLTRILFNSTVKVKLTTVNNPIPSQELLAAQMMALLGEPMPKVVDKVKVAHSSLWDTLSSEMNKAGLI